MYRKSNSTMGPWTEIYAIGACIYACMVGRAPPTVPKRQEQMPCLQSLAALAWQLLRQHFGIGAVAMDLEPVATTASVFALHKALTNDTHRRYTQLSMAERVRLQLGAFIGRGRWLALSQQNAP